MSFEPEIINEIKQKINIVDIISKHVKLTRTGANYIGCCPFHKEKTGSMSVSSEKGIFKCFGCGESGDVISFIQKFLAISFSEAVIELGRGIGLELEDEDHARVREQKSILHRINKATANFYNNYLLKNPYASTAKEYLRARKITEDVIEEFCLGLSPADGTSLFNYLYYDKDFNISDIEIAGSVKEHGGEYYDRFKARLIIPIQDEVNNYIAFGGRLLQAQNNSPKYLNSPETPIYNKSTTLYGLNKSRTSIKESGSVVLMEGFFDVITAYWHGLTNVVGICSSSITEGQIKLLNKYCRDKKYYLALDADAAGQGGIERGAELIKGLIQDNAEVKVISNPSGKDPDEYIRTQGIDSYVELIHNSKSIIDHKIDSILCTYDGSSQSKLSVAKKVVEILNEIDNTISREDYIRHVALKLNISTSSIIAEMNRNKKRSKTNIPQLIKRDACLDAQKNLLAYFFSSSELNLKYWIISELQEIVFPQQYLELIKNKIAEVIYAVETVSEKHNGDIIFELVNKNIEEEQKQLLIELALIELNVTEDSLCQFLGDNKTIIETKIIKDDIERKKTELLELGDDEAEKIGKEIQELLQKLEALNDCQNRI